MSTLCVSGLRTTCKPDSAQGIQLIRLLTENGFSLVLRLGSNVAMVETYHLQVHFSHYQDLCQLSSFEIQIPQKMVLNALLLIHSCPWLGLCIFYCFSNCGND